MSILFYIYILLVAVPMLLIIRSMGRKVWHIDGGLEQHLLTASFWSLLLAGNLIVLCSTDGQRPTFWDYALHISGWMVIPSWQHFAIRVRTKAYVEKPTYPFGQMIQQNIWGPILFLTVLISLANGTQFVYERAVHSKFLPLVHGLRYCNLAKGNSLILDEELFDAIERQYSDAVSVSLEAGTSPLATHASIQNPGSYENAITYAAQLPDTDITDRLINALPLDMRCASVTNEAKRVLGNLKDAPEIPGKDARESALNTALFSAVRAGQAQQVRLLSRYGACPDLTNETGKLLMRTANGLHNAEVIAALQSTAAP